jgi:hypothetical protein
VGVEGVGMEGVGENRINSSPSCPTLSLRGHSLNSFPLTCTSTASASSGPSGPWVTMRQAAVKWLSSPQGEPSGVWTGQKKPQDSGRSFRTWGVE